MSSSRQNRKRAERSRAVRCQRHAKLVRTSEAQAADGARTAVAIGDVTPLSLASQSRRMGLSRAAPLTTARVSSRFPPPAADLQKEIVMTTSIPPACLLSTHRLDRRSLVALASGALLLPARSLPVAAQGIRAATPAPVADLDAILASGVARGLPGIALAIAHGNALVYSGASGVASIEAQTPLQTTDRFRIYSITKTFTATVVLQLVDEGTLTLDDTAAQWLDDPAVGRIPNVDTVTVSQLLRHTSGIYDFADDDDSPFWEDAFLGPDADWTKVWTIEELLGYADGANHAPYFAPGEGTYYANTNYLLLGLIIEQATGRPFRESLQSRILDPLSLADTFLAEGSAMPDGMVDGYQALEGELVNVSSSNLSWIWAARHRVDGDRSPAICSGGLLGTVAFRAVIRGNADVWSERRVGIGMGCGRVPDRHATRPGRRDERGKRWLQRIDGAIRRGRRDGGDARQRRP
jgi:CubicO group peptidase (beta-lactamase class C family)